MNMPIVQKIEICFWDVIIHLLSRSALVRQIVQKVSRYAANKELIAGLVMVFVGGMAGLMLGIVAPMILRIVR